MRNDFEHYDSDHQLKKEYIFPYSQVRKGSSIILYGAGEVGQSYYRQIQESVYCNVTLWVDQKYLRYVRWGLDVHDISEIIGCTCDYAVIAIADATIAREINRLLVAKGVAQEKIVWIADDPFIIRKSPREYFYVDTVKECALRVLASKRIAADTKEGNVFLEETDRLVKDPLNLVIPRLVVELTTVCSLQCKACNNLMPLYRKGSAPAAQLLPERVVQDLTRILEAADRILIVELIGGEPFCYPHLAEIFNYVAALNKVDCVEITTNGTIVPNDEVLSRLHNDKLLVRISRYPHSKETERLCAALEKHQIRYDVMDELVWTDSGKPVFHNRTESELRTIYAKCSSSRLCKTLYRGKLFPCARAASLFDLGIYTDETQYVDLCWKEYDLKQAIIAFYEKTFAGACDYCDATDCWRQIEAGVQL